MKIGELARRTECQVGTIRFYEKKGLLPEPARNAGNYRLYDEAHIERLQFIQRCRSLDMTLSEVWALQKYMDTPDQNCDEVKVLLGVHIHQVEVRVEELLRLKQRLVALLSKCSGVRTVASCGILRGLSDGTNHPASVDE